MKNAYHMDEGNEVANMEGGLNDGNFVTYFQRWKKYENPFYFYFYPNFAIILDRMIDEENEDTEGILETSIFFFRSY